MRIIVSGGGTGGHIYPAITLINTIKEKCPGAEFLYVGTRQGLEADIVPKEGLPFATVDLQGFERRLTPKNFLRAGKAVAAVAKAAKLVRDFRPDAVIGTGGYVCGPVLMAASLMKIPTLIQEQNVLPGITNKILARFVTRIATGAEAALKAFPQDKAVFTGNPIRREVMAAERQEGAAAFGFDPAKKTIFVVGGSLGAGTLNRTMKKWIVEKSATADYQVLWQNGKYYKDSVNAFMEKHKPANVVNLDFIKRMDLAYAVADILISRAGAGTISELCVAGKATIFVPSPNVAEDHQRHNAMALVEKDAAMMVLDSEAEEKLMDTAEALLNDSEKIAAMERNILLLGKKDAADRIAQMVLEMIKKD